MSDPYNTPPPTLSPTIAPGPSGALTESIRIQLRAMLDKPVTVGNLRQLARFAERAGGMLSSIAGVPEPEEIGQEGTPTFGQYAGGYAPSVLAPAPPAETFGVKVIQEMLATAPAFIEALKGSKESPEALVKALAAAREANLADAVEVLERRLGIVKPLGTFIPASAARIPDTVALSTPGTDPWCVTCNDPECRVSHV